MGKKVGGILLVCLVAIAIVSAVVALIATSQEDEGRKEGRKDEVGKCVDNQVGCNSRPCQLSHMSYGSERKKSE